MGRKVLLVLLWRHSLLSLCVLLIPPFSGRSSLVVPGEEMPTAQNHHNGINNIILALQQQRVFMIVKLISK